MLSFEEFQAFLWLKKTKQSVTRKQLKSSSHEKLKKQKEKKK